jgi:hypothetical protein
MRLHCSAAAAILLGIFLCILQNPCSAQKVPAVSVDTDRWIEIDLYWFKQQALTESAHEFWDRFQPLFAGVRGYRGVILNGPAILSREFRCPPDQVKVDGSMSGDS